MKASEVVKKLQELISQSGDFEVFFPDGEWGHDWLVESIDFSKEIHRFDHTGNKIIRDVGFKLTS